MADEDTQILCATKVQSLIRRALARLSIVSKILKRTEKIWDPRREEFYYYDIVTDISSWRKPRLLRNIEIEEIAPTYTPDEAAGLIVRQCLRRAALRRVRMLYKNTIIATYDEGYGATYYYNEKTMSTTWELPEFMNGTMEYEYDKLPLGGTIAGQERQSDSDSEDSDLSVDSEVARKKKRAKRKMPRSKVQRLIDRNEDTFRNSPFSSLSLERCNISHRLTNRIWDLTTLQTLNISHNAIEKISSNIQYLIKLQELNVSHNKLTGLPKKMEDLSLLRVFLAHHNAMSTFTGYLFKCSRLETLDLSFNQFVKLPIVEGNLELLKATKQWEVGIGVLKALKYLNLRGNKFLHWPEQLDKNTKLLELDMSENFLTFVPSVIDKNTALTVLDLSNNLLLTLPTEIYYLPIKKLFLNNNCLEDLPILILPKATDGSITNHGKNGLSNIKMSSIVEIDISFNKIAKLDFRVGLFEKARKFIANDNCISVIHENIGLMKQCKEINLARNKISGTSIVGIGYCEGLTQLDLRCNMIDFIPESFATLRSMTDLNLSDNMIHTIPERLFASFLNMHRIDLHNNQIKALPMTLFAMRKLVYLDVSFNCISQPMPKQLEQFVLLETLMLNHNRFTELPNTISALSLLQVLEVDTNMLTRFPVSISKLKRLKRVTTRLNQIEIRPHGLLHCPNLISWDMGWNTQMVANAIHWDTKFANYRKDVDIMSIAFLRKLLLKANLAIGIGDERKDTAAIHDARIIIDTFAESSVTNSSSTGKKKKKKKYDPKAEEEQTRLEEGRRLRLLQIKNDELHYLIKWHSRMKDHFESHLIRFVSPVYTRTSLPTESVLIADVEANLLPLEHITQISTVRRTNVQFLSMMRDINLTSSLSRDPTLFFQQLQMEVPALELIASLDLGFKYQEGIELFEMLAHEIFINSTLALNEEKKQIVMKAKAKRRALFLKKGVTTSDVLASNASDTVEEKSLSTANLEEYDETSPLTTRTNIALNTSRTNNEDGVVLLDMALGEDEMTDVNESLREDILSENNTALLGLDPDGKDLEDPTIHDFTITWDDVKLENECLQKNEIVDWKSVPSIPHSPLLGGPSAGIFRIGFECYFGMGVAIIHRIDKISIAIRNLEMRGNLKMSCLDIAQRHGNDFKDMVAEVYEETVELMKKKEESASGSYAERKKKKMAAFMNASGANDVQVEDPPVEEKEEPPEVDKKTGKKKKKKAKVLKVAEIEDTSNAEKLLRKKQAEAVGSDPVIGEPIDIETATSCTKYLFEHRKLLGIWALKALDVAAEMLKLLGWNTTTLSPGPEASKEQEGCVENGAEHMRHQAIELHYYRARAQQALELYDKCLLEYQSLVSLCRGQFHRKAELEVIKVTLAKSDFIAGKQLLMTYIEIEVDHADLKFPEPYELLKDHFALALLLMYTYCGCEQLSYVGYGRPQHTISFEILDTGIFHKPKPIKESDVWKVRHFEKDILHVQNKRADVREAEMVVQTENIANEMKTVLADAKSKFHHQLDELRIELDTINAQANPDEQDVYGYNE